MPGRAECRARLHGNGQLQRPGQPRFRRAFAVAAVLAGLSGCDLAPAYDPPQYVLPANWRGQGPTVASPGDTLQRGPWWERFGDPLLNRAVEPLPAAERQRPDVA